MHHPHQPIFEIPNEVNEYPGNIAFLVYVYLKIVTFFHKVPEVVLIRLSFLQVKMVNESNLVPIMTAYTFIVAE